MVDEESTTTIKLVSNDDKEFVLPTATARLSKIVDNAFDDEEDNVTPPETFDILRVRGECLEKVVEFLKHYVEEPMREIPMPLGGSTMDEVSYINDQVHSKLCAFRDGTDSFFFRF